MANIGNFEIIEELGRGAMGVVFRGFDPAIGRPVAIKVIRAQAFATNEENQEARLRFAREAAAAGRLSHPNIVTVFHLGEERDYQYLVMELVDGKALERAAPEQCLPILRQLAGALDYAHAQGVVHRDIKPANILVRTDGQVKLTDFGIARISSHTMTQTDRTLGTAPYMAPEQFVSSRVDGKADQFSLAVVAFELLTGRRPFGGQTRDEVMFAIVYGSRPAAHELNPALPPAVSEVLQRAMAKEAVNRFAACMEFVGALEAALAPPAARAPVVDAEQERTVLLTPHRPPRPQRRFGFAPVAAVGAAAAALVLAVYALVPRSSNAPPVEKKEAAATPAKTELPATVSPTPAIAPRQEPPAETEPISRPPKFRPLEPVVVLPPPAPVAPRQDALAAGTVKANAKDGQPYVWVPPGTFRMGCSPGDSECFGNEPPRIVTISKGFWMGQTEVTQRAYQELTGQNPSRFKGDGLPVAKVSWNESERYCQAAGMRLPTEAEWEYAARAGSRDARYGEIGVVAWYNANSGNRTHPAGQRAKNGFGLYDMLGSVWEWTADWYDADHKTRVARGGSWYNDPRYVRASMRNGYEPGDLSHEIGLRCAGEIP